MTAEREQSRGFDRRAIPCRVTETMWHAPGGWPVRRIDWVAPARPRGSMLFLPGRGDHYEKYLETLQHFADMGWRVTASDWRGQAGSGRLGSSAAVGHVGDFSVWIDDLAALWAQWTATTPAPHILFAHSMGGHLALRAVAEARVRPDALLLSAPMLGLRGGILPQWLGRAIFAVLARAGRPDRPAWTVSEKPGARLALRQSLLTHDADRYADESWWLAARPALHTGPASVGWVRAALASTAALARPGVLEAVDVPVFIAATRADQLVDTRRTIRDAARLPDCRLKLYGAEAAHELLREVDAIRTPLLAEMAAFLDEKAPAR